MEIIESPGEMTAWAEGVRSRGERIALVPTMGYFHEGHLALMRRGAALADRLVVSLFVNPIQFGPNEDLNRYPRAFARDREAAAGQGAAVLFAPRAEDVYPSGFASRVAVEGLTDTLCGASRPGHFTGVTTVVTKLFHMVAPHVAVFGEKDFQQLAVIRRMVADLNFPVEVIGHPIVREADGLAMSSRNSYLDPEERRRALCLYRSLVMAAAMVAGGERKSAAVETAVKEKISSLKEVSIDYVSIVDAKTLAPSPEVNPDSLLALAVKVGRTRLIDNCLLMDFQG